MKVKDKRIIVTGGGNGIGRDLTLTLLRNGAEVIALDLNDKYLKETVELSGSHKSKLFTYTIDVSDKKKVGELVAQLLDKFDGIDGLINNAGIIQPFVKVNELDYELMEKVMKVNFWGVIYMTKSLIPHLTNRPEAHIVNVASMGGLVPVPGQTIYCASKAAVILATEGLACELLNTNVHVSVAIPGAIDTKITENSGVKLTRYQKESATNSSAMLSSERAAEIILDGIEQNKYRILVGKDARMVDTLSRISPKYASNMIAKKMEALLETA